MEPSESNAARLADANQELILVKSELLQARTDLERSAQGWKDAQAAARGIRGSWRWRVGNLIVAIMARILHRRSEPQALDRLEQLFQDCRRWSRGGPPGDLASRRSAESMPLRSNGATEHRDWRREAIPASSVYRLPAPDSAMQDAGISVIVLNRNGARLLKGLFRSMERIDWPARWEVIVVDHASDDDSLAVLETFGRNLPVRIIALKENRRYAESNNRAVRETRYPYLLLLNNNIVLQNASTVREALRALQDPCVGIVGLKLCYPVDAVRGGNRMQHAGIRFRADAKRGFYRPRNLQPPAFAVPPGDAYRVPAVTAAAAFCRRDDYLALDGFHEGYDYGYEDVDLCLKYRRQLQLGCVVLNRVSAIHDESSTQKTDDDAEVRARGKANTATLRHRFGYGLRRLSKAERMRGEVMWTDDPVVVGFVVTEASANAKAGDCFTALELGEAITEECGWPVRLIPVKDNVPRCFDVAGIDILIVMIDDYDLGDIRNVEPGLITIAWMRNWFDRWVAREWFDRFDLFLCSSRKAARFVEQESGKPARVLRIATNDLRFSPGPSDADRDIDYCFTGSSWSQPREIDAFDPGRLPYRFALFGHGWQGHTSFLPFWGGFAPYHVLPSIYRRSRIVVDDANHVTKPWGSVNSRVFDALSSGALVITNGADGAREIFDDLMPSYSNADGLERLLHRYLREPELLASTTEALRERVLAQHTYRHRARELQQILIETAERKWRFAIKVPAANQSEAYAWGDYHFARSLARSLTRAGHLVRIDRLADWYGPHCIDDDVVLVLRGLSRYEPQPDQINLIWNISHPENVTEAEYNAFDQVFVASDTWAKRLASQLKVPVTPLLQCTDPEVFQPDPDDAVPSHRLLFVGNARQPFRAIVRDAIDARLPITIYGSQWDEYIPTELIGGDHIPNDVLRKFYSRCGILLNDHWPGMRKRGFLSNRLFDAAACAAVVVSDDVADIREIFHDGITVYNGTPDDLAAKVEDIRRRPDIYRERARGARAAVLDAHTFAHRAAELLTVVQSFHDRKVFRSGSCRQSPRMNVRAH